MKHSYLLAAACCLLSSPAFAQVDQSNSINANAPVGISAVDQTNPYYQSFTPMLSGINYATFYFYNTAGSHTIVGNVNTNGPSVLANFVVSVYSGEGSFSSSNLLGTSAPSVVPPANVGNIQFDFANTIALTPGQKYSLLISDLTAIPRVFFDDAAVAITGQNAYTGGRAAAGFGADADLVFSEGLRPTATGAVPEVATWAMMILGMGAIGLAMRRQVIASEDKFNAKLKQAYAEIGA